MSNGRVCRLVAVTGASGFIGGRLCEALETDGQGVRRVIRKGLQKGSVCVGDVGSDTDWRSALEGVDCVIHTVARAHILNETSNNAIAEFRRVNTAGSRRLAEQAAACGVRRLVFISSIGVLGNNTNGRPPFDHNSVPAPIEDYSISKLEAEQALAVVARNTDLEIVIVRPPLVYGENAPGNFGKLVRLIERGFPAPFGLVNNRRSFVALDNLVDLLIRCVDHPAATGRTILVSDGHDLSTPELIRGLAKEMGRNARLLPVPPGLLTLAGRLTGRLPVVERLIGSLQVDTRDTCETLDWTPPVTVEEGLRRVFAERI